MIQEGTFYCEKCGKNTIVMNDFGNLIEAKKRKKELDEKTKLYRTSLKIYDLFKNRNVYNHHDNRGNTKALLEEFKEQKKK